MIKKLIKKWLGINKIEAEIYNLNNDVLSIMDKQLEEIIDTKILNKRKKNAKKIRSSSKSR